MTNLPTLLGSIALTSLLAVIIATPALAAPLPAPAGTVVMPALVVTPSIRCTARPLVQGSGSVRICEQR